MNAAARFSIRLTATERLAFGVPVTDGVADEVRRAGAERVFVMISSHLLEQTDTIARLESVLGRRLVGVHHGVQPHVPVEDVIRATAAARSVDPDLIVTIGGGSLSDCGKLVPLCLTRGVTSTADFDGVVERYRCSGGEERSDLALRPDVRVVAVPTTLSGGEYNAKAGVTLPESGKNALAHRMSAPVAVILDPALAVHTPEQVWLSTGVGAVDHAVEVLASVQSNPYVDGLAETALRLLLEGLIRTKDDPSDVAARLQCQIGAWYAVTPIIAGFRTGLAHAIGYVLGSLWDVPHGLAASTVMPAVQRWNAGDDTDPGGRDAAIADRQRRLSAIVGSADEPAHVPLRELAVRLGLPSSLEELGIRPQDHARIAERTMLDPLVRASPRLVVSARDVEAVLSLAQRGS